MSGVAATGGTIGVVATHAFLDGLDPAQLSAATAPLGPVRVLAGPGAGKTRTVVARIGFCVAEFGVGAENILALSHTTKAAGELRDRVAKVDVRASAVTSSTIHAAAWFQVRHLAATAGMRVPQLMPSVYNAVRSAAETAHGRRVSQPELLDLVSEIDWARARLLGPDSYEQDAAALGRNAPTGEFAFVAETWRRYMELKADNGVADFADVLELARTMMASPEVAEKVRRRWQVFFVDEYQDVDPAQQALLEAWLGDGEALTAVGDPNQAIFAFKGGDPALLTGFDRRWPNARTVELTANYRSTPQIVEWVNRARTVEASPLVGCRAEGPQPRVEFHGSESDEVHALVAQVRAWLRAGVPASEIAVLYRFNSAAARVEAALTSAGVNYSMLGAAKFFDRAEVKALLGEFSRRASQEPSAPAVSALESAARDCGWDPVNPPEGVGAARARFEALDALVVLVREQMSFLSAAECDRELARRAREAHEPSVGGVRVGTIHAAKGLEWQAVWVLGVVEGQIPSAYAKTPEQLIEEQNALYVAMSRAKEHLVLSVPARSTQNWTLKPSRFLDLVVRRPPTTPTAGRAAGRTAGRSSGRSTGRSTGRSSGGSGYSPRSSDWDGGSSGRSSRSTSSSNSSSTSGRSRSSRYAAERADAEVTDPVLRPKATGEFTCQSCFLILPKAQKSKTDPSHCRDCG